MTDIAIVPSPSQDTHKWWALAATCFGLFMALLDVTVVSVALPTIQRDLNASFADLQWVISAYTISLAIFLVTAGRLGDIFGRKRVFIIGLGLFTFGSFLCSISSDVTIGSLTHTNMLIISRAIQGVGGSIMFPLSLAIISSTFHGKERGAAIGIWGGVSGLGSAIGPVIGGILVAKVGWQSIFYVNIPIGVVGMLLSAWAIRESRDEKAKKSVDIFGLLTITVSMFCLILGLIQGNDADKGFTSPYILTLFAVSGVTLALFIVVELRLKNPMVDPCIFRNASFTGAAIAGFCVSAGIFSLLFFLTLYFQNFLGFNALEAGLRFLPIGILSFVGAPIAGRLTDRIGAKPVVFVALVCLAAGALLMTRIGANDQQNDWTILLPGLLLAGIGIGLVNPPLSTVAVGTVDRSRVGMASGVASMCRQIGNAFGIAFLGALLTSRYDLALQDKVTALNAPGLPAAAKGAIVSGLRKAGTIVGSTGLRLDPAHPSPYASQPIFPSIQGIVRLSFINGLHDIFRVAAVILALGAVASLLLIKRSDLAHERAAASETSHDLVAEPLAGR